MKSGRGTSKLNTAQYTSMLKSELQLPNNNMKTIILLITLVLCNLSFGCVILPNGNYIPCETNTTKILIENKKIIDNIEYNVKLAESRLNEAEVKYIESIKKYKTARHNAASKSFIKSLIKQKVNAGIAQQEAYPDIVIQKAFYEDSAQQEAYFEITFAKQQAYSEMLTAKLEYEDARRECGRIYAIAKGEQTYLPVGKSPLKIFKLVK